MALQRKRSRTVSKHYFRILHDLTKSPNSTRSGMRLWQLKRCFLIDRPPRASLYCKLGDTPTHFACQPRLGLRPRSLASGLKLILVYFPTLSVTGQLRTPESINVIFSLESVAFENDKDLWKNGSYQMVNSSIHGRQFLIRFKINLFSRYSENIREKSAYNGKVRPRSWISRLTSVLWENGRR